MEGDMQICAEESCSWQAKA